MIKNCGCISDESGNITYFDLNCRNKRYKCWNGKGYDLKEEISMEYKAEFKE